MAADTPLWFWIAFGIALAGGVAFGGWALWRPGGSPRPLGGLLAGGAVALGLLVLLLLGLGEDVPSWALIVLLLAFVATAWPFGHLAVRPGEPAPSWGFPPPLVALGFVGLLLLVALVTLVSEIGEDSEPKPAAKEAQMATSPSPSLSPSLSPSPSPTGLTLGDIAMLLAELGLTGEQVGEIATGYEVVPGGGGPAPDDPRLEVAVAGILTLELSQPSAEEVLDGPGAPLGCGQDPIVCDTKDPLGPGPLAGFAMEMGDAVPLAGPDLLQYVLRMDVDGKPGNNFAASPDLDGDPVGGTDRAWVLGVQPGGAPDLFRLDFVGGHLQPVPTAARVAVVEEYVLFLVPEREWGADSLVGFGTFGRDGVNPETVLGSHIHSGTLVPFR